MASCEICGIQIIDHGERVYVEGNLLTVCKACSKRGKPSNNQQNIQRKLPARPKKIEKPDKITFEDSAILVKDFSEVIRNSRMSKGFTHEQLGFLIQERASLLRKIESGSLKPDEVLAKKLERFFRINLYTEVDSSE
ncbi:MAG: multiprotein bridging factor aMBF1 [Nitrososphaeraceae archaeon]|jgi:putative transcription factor|nr:multiprotein bridging factor aMBF1 [Nitrososphaeraceae archaeon]MDW0143138.1 multiprotein bridging factor aMBF1 [Nitrososphaeraceae archaeon]MDW0167673.1 multiprotein bridging factor aMBF1 [Nitrososphaeraceae archaeon]